MSAMTRDEALRIVREARERGEQVDLGGANLRGADLRDADLRCADLWDANLRDANLRYADLRDADLRCADLWGADLGDANLWGANLRGANGGLLALDGLPSGSARLVPTPDGWSLRVGCWVGTPDTLRTLIAGTDWPQARGTEQDRRRPALAALADLCDAHAAMHPDLIADLAAKWGAK